MGITNYAQASLGDIAYVELPAPGEDIEKGGTSL
jgi:glycine cleavage system H lipoate-binding protein